MHESNGMDLCQGLGRLARDVDGPAHIERKALLEETIQGLAFEQLHDHVESAVRQPAEVENLHHVLIVDGCHGHGFLAEPLHGSLIATQGRMENLDGHMGPQSNMPRTVYRAARPSSYLTLDQIAFGHHGAHQGGARRLLGTAARTEQGVIGEILAALRATLHSTFLTG